MSHKDVVLLIREKNVNDNVAINNIIADNSMQQPNIENFDKLTLSNGVMCGISPIDSNSINEIVHIFMEIMKNRLILLNFQNFLYVESILLILRHNQSTPLELCH